MGISALASQMRKPRTTQWVSSGILSNHGHSWPWRGQPGRRERSRGSGVKTPLSESFPSHSWPLEDGSPSHSRAQCRQHPPHPVNSSTSTLPFLPSDGCLLWNIWFCSSGLNSWWFKKKKKFKRSLLPLGQKKIHLRSVIQSFLLGEKGSLPSTTFHTGGVAFDLKRLWQFTSELLFIYPKHWAC